MTKYKKNTIHTELYRLAWDYSMKRCSWDTVKYMREAIYGRYEESFDELMDIWKAHCRNIWKMKNTATPR